MSKVKRSKEKYEDLRRLVEAVDKVADDDQMIAPTIDEIAGEFEYHPQSILDSIEENYGHVVRTAGYVPTTKRNTGDKMALYDKILTESEEFTLKTIKETDEVGIIRARDGEGLTHNQALENLGLDPNHVWTPSSSDKVYDVDGDKENVMHEIRRRNDQSLKENNIPVRNEELSLGHKANTISKIRELRREAGVPYEPITRHGAGTLTGERETEVFDFWVEEYLERDWEGKSPEDVDIIMKMSMVREGVSDWELNGVAEKYEKWVDWSRYD